MLFKWALRKELVTTNPCDKVELPSDERARDRVASRDEAAKLLAALTDDDCAVWATAFYAGLRRGELMGLRWSDVDLQARTIKVRRSYDPGAQRFVAPKTKNGRRDVGIPKVLVAILAAHKLRSTHELCFASSTGRPFRDDKLRDRARDVWGWRREGDVWVKARPDALEPIGLHEARHTYASWLIAGGANLKAISMAMGHGGIQITLDTYGHLLPGDVETTTAQLDAYLDAAGAG